MALVAIHAVVNVSADALVILIGLALGVTVGALEDGIVVRIDMAGRTHAVGIPVIGGELRVLRVIESRVQPARRRMARLAGGWDELRLRRVSRVRGVVVIRLVATNAGRRQSGVVVVDVAVRAHSRRNRVHTG